MNSFCSKHLSILIILSIFLVPTGLFAAGKQVVSTNSDTGSGSLRYAVANSSDGDTIVFNIPSNDTIVVGEFIQIPVGLVIVGINQATGNPIVLRSQDYKLIFSVLIENSQLTMQDMIFAGGHPNLYVKGTGARVEINRCSFRHGYTSDYNTGGSITIDSTFAIITNCRFADNKSYNDGAAIYNRGGSIELSHDTIENNTVQGYGSYYSDGGTNKITDCVFKNNNTYKTLGNGAAVALSNGDMVLSNCIIKGNHSAGKGGAIVQYGGNLTFENCDISNNSSNNDGGAICINSGYCTFTGCTIVNDSSIIYHDGNDMEAFSSSPSLECVGGAIFNGGFLVVKNSAIANNVCMVQAINIYTHANDLEWASYSVSGGGIYNSGYSYILNSTMFNNIAFCTASTGQSIMGLEGSSYGGAILIGAGLVVLQNTTLTDNWSRLSISAYNWNNKKQHNDGGGIYCGGGSSCLCLNSLLMNNKASVNGEATVKDFVSQSIPVNSLFQSGTISTTKNSKTVGLNEVFGAATPVLASNGGATQTVMPLTSTSAISGYGLENGYYMIDTVPSSGASHILVPMGAYKDGTQWISLSTGQPIPDTATVEMNSTDQRGIAWKNPPSIGSVEFEPTIVSIFHKNVSGKLRAFINYSNNTIQFKSMRKNILQVSIFSFDGKLLYNKKYSSPVNIVHVKNSFVMNKAVICRMITTELTVQKTFVLSN